MYEQVDDMEISIKALADYMDISSITDLKRIFYASTVLKYKKSATIDDKLFKDMFCILVSGAVRHFRINDESGEEQTLRFTFSCEVLYTCQLIEIIEEGMQSISDCMVLAVPYALLQKFGEDEHLKKNVQELIMKNLEFEVSLLRMPPEMRYKILIRRCRDIFLIVPLKHIASFLGITPQALCRIRKRLL